MVELRHELISRASLIPRDGRSTLLTRSGVQPLVPYVLGAEHPSGSRLANSQPCLRVQDLEEVGDNRHTTFFEMLGNWSLGDYFKDKQISQFWTFLTERVGLDPQRIYVSCFAGDPSHGMSRDEESAGLWTALFGAAGIIAGSFDAGSEENAAQVGTRGARIVFYRRKNWWCRCGTIDDMPVGEPGGANTEVFYLFPSVQHDPAYGVHCHQNCDCGRFIELGNSVFMEYVRTETGFDPLPRRSVDCGAGLERIAAASLDTPDVFKSELLWPIIEQLEQLSGRTYEEETAAMRNIADHLRGATFLTVDSVRPSNKAQGYVMRRLVRRAIRFAHGLGLEGNFLPELVPTISGIYEAYYPEVAEHGGDLVAVLAKEEQAFRETLRNGMKQLKSYRKASVTGVELFMLYDTYGFPVELSSEEARRQGIGLSVGWREEFEYQMAQQRTRSLTAVWPDLGHLA